MTPHQFFTRLKTWLRALVWENTVNKVFGNAVFITVKLPIMQISQYQSPCCFIIDKGAISHPEHPGLLTQNGQMIIYVENVQSNYGEGGIMDACRTANTSRGAGILSIKENLLNQLVELTALTTKLTLVETSQPPMQTLAHNEPLALCFITFKAFLSIY